MTTAAPAIPMTDRPGRSAGWNTALLLVPGTAALFGAAVAWAADTPPPVTAPKPAPPSSALSTPAAAPAADALYLRVEEQIAAHRRSATRLQLRLAAIRADLAKAAAASAAAARSGDAARSGNATPAGPPVQTGPQNGAPAANQPVPAPAVPAPAPVPQPAPVVQPPPPVHTSTGASG
jgi:ribonuclease E